MQVFDLNVTCSVGPVSTSERPLYDKDGALSGFEAVRRVEKELPGSTQDGDFCYVYEKTEGPEEADATEDAEEDEVDEEGMTEEDIEAEKDERRKWEDERNRVKLENWGEFVKETERMNQYLAQQRA